jgi:hypothetical protein
LTDEEENEQMNGWEIQRTNTGAKLVHAIDPPYETALARFATAADVIDIAADLIHRGCSDACLAGLLRTYVALKRK